MSNTIRKQFDITRKGDEIIVNTGAFDREKDRVFPSGARLENYMKNPVMLWGHNYRDPGYVIGTAKDIRVDDQKIIVRPDLRKPASDNDPMNIIRALWDAGIIRTASIGFLPLNEPKRNEKGGFDFDEWELLEISLVPVPANQEALRLAAKGLDNELDEHTQDSGIVTLSVDDLDLVSENINGWTVNNTWTWDQKFILSDETVKAVVEQLTPALADMLTFSLLGIISRGAIPYKKHPLASPDADWNGPAEVRKASVDDLRVMCAWFDSANPEVKASYKLPHHRADDHYTVWAGVRAAMAALLGARGGVRIPEEDRRGVYNHLARHYREFDKEPPELREYSPDELKALFPDLYEGPALEEMTVARLANHLDQLIQSLKERT